VEQILVSVIAMLNEPNVSSPANIDAAVQFRDDPRGYRRRVRELAAKTIEE
jgi:ubiquitin-conjugating enzyme E2 G1